jgi:hypothetical protein
VKIPIASGATLSVFNCKGCQVCAKDAKVRVSQNLGEGTSSEGSKHIIEAAMPLANAGITQNHGEDKNTMNSQP